MSDLIRKRHAADPGDHVTPWLGAYLDGEITPGLREEIESHLAGCLMCQNELESLEQLSMLLQSDPPPTPHSSDRAFARQIVAQIRQPAPPWWQRMLLASWRFAPLMLFGAWAFFQAVGWVSTLALAGMSWIPGIDEAFQAFMPFSVPSGSWLFGDLLRMSLASPVLREAAGQTAWLEPAGIFLLFQVAVSAILAVLFSSWLASWWAYHRSKA
jgi:hypothetical protein